MMWWDRLVGTYKYPEEVRQFNKSLEKTVLGGSNYAIKEAPEGAPRNESLHAVPDAHAHHD